MARTPSESRAPRRRSISVKASTYARAKVWSEQTGESISSMVEVLLNDFLASKGIARVDVPRVMQSRTCEEIASQHFTF
jgi:hypothetical protein